MTLHAAFRHQSSLKDFVLPAVILAQEAPMKKLLAAAALLILFAVPAFAQTPTPAPAPLSSGNIFSVSAGYANMASTATNNGFQMTGILTLTQGTYSLLGLRADTMILSSPNVTLSII